MTSDHLYIIGNGFDCYHGAKCSYAEFRKYLLRHRPYVLATFDLYFGPRSLMNSFESFKDCLRCLEISWGCSSGDVYPKTTWAENNLWWRNHGKTKSARTQKRNVFSTDKNEM